LKGVYSLLFKWKIKNILLLRHLIRRASLFVLVVGYSNVCIAVKEIKQEIMINSSPPEEIVEGVVYEGIPEVQMSLTTLGVERPETEGIVIRRWYESEHDQGVFYRRIHEEKVVGGSVLSSSSYRFTTDLAKRLLDSCILATCTLHGGVGGGYTRLMYDVEEKAPTLVCPEGWGISVKFLAPSDYNNKKFVYHATLTMTQHDEKQKGIKQVQIKDDRIGEVDRKLVTPFIPYSHY
jgi:hypothetical protein